MRPCLVILSLALLRAIMLFPDAAHAEVLLGRLLDIDKARGQMRVERLAGDGGDDQLVVPFSEEQYRDWSLDRLSSGQLIRLWTDRREENGRPSMVVNSVTPGNASMGGRRDMTGVRSRLGGGMRGGEPGRGGGGRH